MSLGQPGSAPATRVHPHSRLLVAVPRFFPLLHAWERGGRAEGVAGGSGRPAGAGGEASGHCLSPEQPWRRLGCPCGSRGKGWQAAWLSASAAVGTAGLGTASGSPRFYRAGLWLWECPQQVFLKRTLRQRDMNRTQCKVTGGRHRELTWLRF